jgi:hypothetical protein
MMPTKYTNLYNEQEEEEENEQVIINIFFY